jgi:hypothetical protein
MPDDVTVWERTFDADGNLVATPGDRISADDARRWGVGPDDKSQAAEAPAPASEPEPVRVQPAPSRPRAANRRAGQR